MTMALSPEVRQAIAAHRPWRSGLVVILADFSGVAVAIMAAIGVRWCAGGAFRLDQVVSWWPLPILVTVLIAQARGYVRTPPHPAEELRRLVTAITLAFILLATATFFLRTFDSYSRIALVLAWSFTVITVPLARVVLRHMCASRTWWGTPVVVIGAGATGTQVIGALQLWASRGLRPVLVLDDDASRHGQQIHGIVISGPIESVACAAADAGITAILLAMPGAPPERIRALWRQLGQRFPTVLIVPGLGEFASLWVEAKDIGGQVALELQQSLLRPSRRFLKRTLDLMLTVIVALTLTPLLLVLVLLVMTSSAGPVFYGQRRLGREGKPFTAWKFRTMRRDADAVLAEVLANDPQARIEWERDHKLRRDPRVTGIGRFLRSTSLDELPQVWNVLRGDMSLVGPRPVTAAEIPKYGDQWEIYTRVRPGITGQWQVSGRNHTTYEERVAWDAFYVHNWSPWLDLVILARTVQTVVRGEGAY